MFSNFHLMWRVRIGNRNCSLQLHWVYLRFHGRGGIPVWKEGKERYEELENVAFVLKAEHCTVELTRLWESSCANV